MRHAWAVGAALAGSVLLLSSIVAPGTPHLEVSRWGEGVRLLPSGWRFSPWFLARRLPLPKANGLAVLEAQLTCTLPSGASAPVRLRLLLEGSGALPLSARALREKPLPQALGEALQRALPDSVLANLWQASDTWTAVFPQATARPRELLAALASALAPLRVVEARVEVDEGLLRAEARAQLHQQQSRKGKLVVIGLDGLDWQLVDELTAKGLMPHLRQLVSQAAQAELEVPAPLISPVIWTTIATGQPPQVHGVLDFLEPDPAGGPPHPVSANSRKVPALWDLLAAGGRRVAVIGWWATFPAQAPPGGVVYSDRLTEQLLGLSLQTPALADPPAAQEEALRLAVRARELTPAQLSPFLPVSSQELAAVREEEWDNPLGGLAKLVAATLTVERLTAKELAANRDALFVYVEATDTVGHLFAPYRPPALPGVDPLHARRFGQVVDRVMAHVDQWLGQVMQRLAPEDSLVLLSDHGFAWGTDRPRVPAGAHTATAVWWHRPVGVLLVRSPHVQRPETRQRLQLLQVAPLLLALAGLPPAAEMPGSAPPWVRQVGSPPVNYATLLGPPTARRVELPPEARAEELAKLKALGYLAGSPAPAAAPSPAASASPAFDRAQARRLNNLASTLATSGDREKAEEVYRQAIAADPTYAPSHYNLSLLLRRLGRFAEADEAFWRAVDLGLADAELTVVRSALDYRERGELTRAEAILRAGLARFPQSVPLLLNAGVFFGERGKLAEAKQLLARAVRLDPNNPKAHRNLAVALAALGETEAAIAELEATLRLDARDQEAQRELARLRRQGVQ